MAIFHLSATIHSRGKGHSAVAGAAYRSRSDIMDERTGERHDYSRKAADVLFEGIYAPNDAPEWTRDRAQLWQHVEAFEKRSDAQLARVFTVALPHELSLEQNRRALQDWVRDNFTRKGLIADVVIHAPDRDGDMRNIHAHVAVVLRKLDGTEFAARKERTASNDERLAQLEGWRESWEKTANRHLERAGSDARIDRRTLKEQGIEAEPTKHLGPSANKMERIEPGSSDRAEANREITQRNAERRNVAALEAEERKLSAEIIDLAAERAKREAYAGARGRYDDLRAAEAAPSPSGPARQAEPEDMRPLGRTAGEIREAWAHTRATGDLSEALAARGITLAAVSTEEARQSERTAVFAKEVGNFARVLRESEIVAVNARGNVHRFDQRTTGDLRPEIEARLAGIDRANLLSVADTKEAMREQARPASWIENRIAECAEEARLSGAVVMKDADGRTVTGAEALADQLRPDGEPALTSRTVRGAEAFAARLDDAGIAVARVTAADKLALDALRQDEDMKRTAAETNIETYQAHHFAQLEEGDLAAVTRNGDVYRINPAKLGDAAPYLSDKLPGVIEARDAFETDREKIAALWAERRADAAADRDAFSAEREARRADAAAERELDQMYDAAGDTFESGSRTTGKFFGGLAKAVESILGGVLGFLAGEPKLTPGEVRAAEERAEARADAAAAEEKEAAIDDQIFMQDRQKAEEEREAELYKRFPGLTRDDDDNGRENDLDRGRERER